MSATASTDLATTPVKRGRPRRADADGAILGATLELLNEVGVAGLSMDLLAQRAGVGKATIYRRWDSKETLILDAMLMTATPIPVPDEGNLRDDLFTYMDAVIECFSPGRGGSDVLPHLIEVKDGFVTALSSGLRLGAVVVLGAAFVAWRFLPARAHDPLVTEVQDADAAEETVALPVGGE